MGEGDAATDVCIPGASRGAGCEGDACGRCAFTGAAALQWTWLPWRCARCLRYQVCTRTAAPRQPRSAPRTHPPRTTACSRVTAASTRGKSTLRARRSRAPGALDTRPRGDADATAGTWTTAGTPQPTLTLSTATPPGLMATLHVVSCTPASTLLATADSFGISRAGSGAAGLVRCPALFQRRYHACTATAAEHRRV